MNSKWLDFNELDFQKRKTKVFEVRNKKTDSFLGTIYWSNGWRQYVFNPTCEPSQLSESCLTDITQYIQQLKKEKEGEKSEHRKQH